MTQSPFIPFIIIFCRVIETSSASDLAHMESLVETLESTSNSGVDSTCDKQRRLFRALYDVAATYVEVKTRADSTQAGISWSTAAQNLYTDVDAFSTSTESNSVGLGANTTGDASGHIPSSSHTDAASFPNALFGDMDLGMDLSGAQLWDWFNKNQSMMRMLEDL